VPPVDLSTVTMRRYLLGELPESEAGAVEDAFIQDDALVLRMEEAEHELIDAFLDDAVLDGVSLGGALSVRERQRFEHHYLASPAHRARVAVARALRREARPVAPVRAGAAGDTVLAPTLAQTRTAWTGQWRGWAPGWAAVAAAVILGVGLWLARRDADPPPQIAERGPSPAVPVATAPPADPAPPPASDPRPPGAASQAPIQLETPAPRPPLTAPVVAFMIPSLVTRGAETFEVAVPRGAVTVTLQLEGDVVSGAGTGPMYARLATADGQTVWSGPARAGNADAGVAAIVQVPATALAPDDYVMTLTTGRADGAEAGRYAFRSGGAR
jgi:hypothetical protein